MAKTQAKSAAPKAKPISKSAPKSASKSVAKKAAAPKSAPNNVASTAGKKSMPVEPKMLSGEERTRMVELAAYHIAERDGFKPGMETDYWLQGEQQVANLLDTSAELH